MGNEGKQRKAHMEGKRTGRNQGGKPKTKRKKQCEKTRRENGVGQCGGAGNGKQCGSDIGKRTIWGGGGRAAAYLVFPPPSSFPTSLSHIAFAFLFSYFPPPITFPLHFCFPRFGSFSSFFLAWLYLTSPPHISVLRKPIQTTELFLATCA